MIYKDYCFLIYSKDFNILPQNLCYIKDWKSLSALKMLTTKRKASWRIRENQIVW